MPKTCLLTATFVTAMAAASVAFAASDVTERGMPVKSEALAFQPFNADMVRTKAPLYTGRSSYRETERGTRHNGRIGYVRGETGSRFGYGRGYVDLVGDRESGVGFYPLPERYRAGAARYRYAHSYYGPYGYGNAVRQAVLFDAIRTPAFTPTSAVNGYRYGVFDPNEGVGTPFFAGYYSAGTRDPDDGPKPIFGNPLD